MIINNTYKFIYVHIPKCGGTTVSNYLSFFSHWRDIELGGTVLGEVLQEQYKLRYHLHKHSTINNIKMVLNDELKKYFIFTSVRNPYTRFISAFNFVYNNVRNPNASWITEKDRNYSLKYENMLDVAEDLQNIKNNVNVYGLGANFLPQYLYIENDDDYFVYIAKIENIDCELKNIVRLCHIDKYKEYLFDRKYQNKGRYMINKIDFKTAQIIKEYYKKDFELFSYDYSPEMYLE